MNLFTIESIINFLYIPEKLKLSLKSRVEYQSLTLIAVLMYRDDNKTTSWLVFFLKYSDIFAKIETQFCLEINFHLKFHRSDFPYLRKYLHCSKNAYMPIRIIGQMSFIFFILSNDGIN